MFCMTRNSFVKHSYSTDMGYFKFFEELKYFSERYRFLFSNLNSFITA